MEEIITLDVKDRKILYELEKNARQSNKAIAKKVGLNTDVVRYRINRLLEEGVIGWFLTFVNFAKLGLTDYGVFFNTQKLTESKEKELINYLIKHNQVSYFAKLGGKYDFVVGILAEDILHFDEILSEIMSKIGEYVSNKDISTRLALFHFPKTYLLDVKRTNTEYPKFGGKLEILEIDDIDKRILRKISTNARMSAVNISSSLDMPPSTVISRIKNLQKREIIEGFFTFIDSSKYGFDNYLLLIDFSNVSKEINDKFHNFCKFHKNISFVIKTVGKWDYEVGIEAPDKETFQKVISEIREKFSDYILDLDFVINFKTLKYDLYPL